MNWNDCEAIWKRQPLPAGAPADPAELRSTFEARRRKLAVTLQVRDWSELSACVLLVGVYAHFWRSVGTAGWPMSFAILLVAGVGGFFVRERLRVRRLRLGASAPLLAKVEADLAELQHQRQLLLKLWRWYLGPCAGAVAIHLAVILSQGRRWLVPEPGFLVVIGLLVLVVLAMIAGLFRFIARLNRQAVAANIEPRIAELEQLRADLLKSA